MKAVEIIGQELKAAGLAIVEKDVEVLLTCCAEKILPRLALEAEEAPAKAIASVLAIAISALKPSLEKAIDKIDGVEGNLK